MSITIAFSNVGPIAAYVCRGCGTEIVNKGAFSKCPVCGIRLG